MSAALLLARESLSDAVRRRIAAAIAVLSLLSLLVVDSCTSCSTGQVMVNGEARELSDLAGAAGVVTFVTLGMWVVVLAGVLAADHLRETLEDGSAHLCLARPVSRTGFALARLSGVLALCGITGCLLLGGTALLLSQRSALPMGPAVGAALACAASCVTVGALAMAASLVLPRMATVLAVVTSVGVIGLANGLRAASPELGGWLGAVDRFGPPLASSMVIPLDPWVEAVNIDTDPSALVLKLAVWAVLAVALLVISFRRAELASG
jgi:ABC-type transport system involved in multi-copper enzyme maturation permease subunit